MSEQDDSILEARVPPHDLDAEAAVLSAVMNDQASFDRVAEFLLPEHFYAEAHRRIYEACMGLMAKGTPPDVVAVASWLRDRDRVAQVGGMSYITSVLNAAPSLANVVVYAKTVHEKYRIRTLIQNCQRVTAQGYAGYGDAQSFIDGAAQALHDLAHPPSAVGTLQPIGTSLLEAYREQQKAQAEGRSLVGLATGIGRVDRVLGGLHDGELLILAARPGKGKSAAALQWAMHIAAAGHLAVLFSLEMPRKQLAMRAACNEARVDVSRWRTGQLNVRDWERLTPAIRTIEKMPLHIDDTPALTALGLRARLRRLAADEQRAGRSRPRLVIVDYLQLMRATPGAVRESRERAVAEIAQDLKNLAMEFGVPIIAPCQMNRQIEQTARRPRLSDLRESGNIEQAADTVVFIHETKERNVVEFVVEKQRNGPNDIVCVRFDRQYTRFDNLADGEYEGESIGHADGCRCGACRAEQAARGAA